MEAIRQNGKIILHSNDGISIKMIFRNLTGRNFQGQEYADYILSLIHISEPTRLGMISYAVFCLKKKKKQKK